MFLIVGYTGNFNEALSLLISIRRGKFYMQLSYMFSTAKIEHSIWVDLEMGQEQTPLLK